MFIIVSDTDESSIIVPMQRIEPLAALLRKIPRRLIGALFIIAVIIFFALYLRSIDWKQLAHLHLSWGYLLLATVFATLFRYLGVIVWRYILADLGAQSLPSFIVMADVYAKSWMGRYIPGTVTWIAGKVYMASAHGISKTRLAISSLLEGGMQIVAVLVVSMVLLGLDQRLNILPPEYKVLMLTCAGLLLLFLTPAIFNRIIRIAYTAVTRTSPHEELLINEKAVLRAFSLYAVGGFIMGLGEFFITRTVYPTLPWHDFWFIVGAFNLSGALGMLAIGVPSGIGVRDSAILLLLSVIMPKELALAVTVTSRLWSSFADIFFFAFANLLYRIKKKHIATNI